MTLTSAHFLHQVTANWEEENSSNEQNKNVDKINYKSNIYDFMLETAACYLKLRRRVDAWTTWTM